MDFKSYVRYGIEPWSAVLDGTMAKADKMRVFLEPGDYYNHEFTDERQWLCLIAQHAGSGKPDLPLRAAGQPGSAAFPKKSADRASALRHRD